MIFKSDKKNKSPILTVATISLAVYGAYSMVASVKESCCEKCKMLTNMFKKKNKATKTGESSCDCNEA